MDKQNKIEKLAKEVYENSNYSQVMSKEIARYIVETGYKKIHYVNITDAESFVDIEDLFTEFDEMGFSPTILLPFPDEYANNWKLRLIRAIGELRNETAEKFAERLKERFKKSREYYEIDTGTAWSDGQIGGLINDKIDEILKEIKGGGK